MRIAQILDTLYWGGAQRMQLFLVETLVPMGVEITVIDLGGTTDSTVPAALTALGARVVSFPFDQLFSPLSFLRLFLFLRAEKFDLIQTYLSYANIAGSLAGRLCGTPVITSIRNADFEYKSYTRKRRMMERFAIRNFSRRTLANGIVVGQFVRQHIGKNTVIDIIPNAIEPLEPLLAEERQALRREILGDPARIMIMSVGRLNEAKGFPDLLEAFAQIHTEFPEAALVIVGGGTLLEELQAQVDAMGLQKKVILLGARSDARRLMATADIYVNSSHWEGTPVTVLEAMATGLPIIATRVGESPYLLAEDSGLLVSPYQPAEIAHALRHLLRDDTARKKLARTALERVRTHYSREAWRDSLLKLYAEEIDSARPQSKK